MTIRLATQTPLYVNKDPPLFLHGSGQVPALRPQDCFLCAKDVICPLVELNRCNRCARVIWETLVTELLSPCDSAFPIAYPPLTTAGTTRAWLQPLHSPLGQNVRECQRENIS